MRSILIIIFLLPISIIAGNSFAADYGKYTTEELANMRGTMQDAPQEEREAFRTEWQRRFQNMTREERQKYTGRPDNAACEPGTGSKMRRREGYRKGMGWGSGSGPGKGRGR